MLCSGICCPDGKYRWLFDEDVGPLCWGDDNSAFVKPINLYRCPAHSKKHELFGMHFCVYPDKAYSLPLWSPRQGNELTARDEVIKRDELTTRDELYCPGSDHWYEVKSGGETTYGTCCKFQYDGAQWQDTRPVCCGVTSCDAKADSVKSCPNGWSRRALIWSGNNQVSVCRKDAAQRRDQYYCPAGDNWLQLSGLGDQWGTCCKTIYTAKWVGKYSPQSIL